ncbi:C6 zinc finger domain protein [Cordyceps fumosorosea ARSEF 2679]|uniref:C6 zinc finger domain protein n=1 Tax=Cordyceps fumosorosea (strain ARSEF 2679) TaxID=1081104 RepID=A0A167FJG9_CORFA|nr:C6 zinc finger domain protein [Cordyceps fumosorosea ARSEF 2679]OAA45359.1 C6 zinc finger domain protein [Cordyceps fumosorosea ARSEF 2679]
MQKQQQQQQQQSPLHTQVRRRRRRVLSCMVCRRRKIKCNRELPCQHCTETQQACHYQAPPSPQLWQASTAAPPEKQQQQQQQPRPSNNWRSVIFSSQSNTPESTGDASTSHQDGPPPPVSLHSPPPSQPSATATDDGPAKPPDFHPPSSFVSQLPQRDYRIPTRKSAAHDSQIVLDNTRILRWSHWMGAGQEFGPIFACYLETLGPRPESTLSPDAKAVLVEAAEVLQKCKRLARSSKIWRPSRLFGIQGYDLMPPTREVADVMTREYFKYFEYTIRILHIPSFWESYTKFWDNPDAATMDTRLTILLIVALGASFQDRSQPSLALPNIAQVHQWIYAAQAWLAGPVEKDRLDIGGLQVYCLLIVARQIYSVGGDLVWMSLGSLLHRAMQLGLHYDPSHFQGMSIFKAELRRRLWYTILEFLVQASLDTAMPPRISAEDFDTEPPANINDNDLDEDTPVLHSKPDSEHTDTTLQRHIIHALPARINIVRYLNAIKTDLSYPEAMSLSTALSSAQRRVTLALQNHADKVSPFQRNMIDFLLRRFVVPLHSPFACEARTTPAFHYSLKACTEASLALINPEPDARFARILDFAGGLFREGLRSANTAISLDLIVQTKTQQADGTLHRTRTVREALKRSVVDMLERCERRIANGETNVKSYVFLAMVLAMTEAMESGEPCETKIAKSAKDALAHCYGILENSLGSFVTSIKSSLFPVSLYALLHNVRFFYIGLLQNILVHLVISCNTPQHQPMKVLISGAGISGTALAFWLAKLDLRGHGIDVLRLMGLDAAFKAKAAPEQGMQVVDGAGRRLAYLAANTSGTGKQNFTSEYEIMRGDLCQLLQDASLERGRVKYLFGTFIKEFKDNKNGIAVTFSNDCVETFDLVVGADGQWSRTRRMMLGTTASPDPALHLVPGMCAGYFTTPAAVKPGEGFDSTLYLPSRKRSVMTRRSDPSRLQVYMACSDPTLQTAHRGDVEREKAAFTASYQGAGWRVPELVAGMQATDDFYCERVDLVKLDVGAWHRGRVVLLGDAAYYPSVLTGMGTTCAVCRRVRARG